MNFYLPQTGTYYRDKHMNKLVPGWIILDPFSYTDVNVVSFETRKGVTIMFDQYIYVSAGTETDIRML